MSKRTLGSIVVCAMVVVAPSAADVVVLDADRDNTLYLSDGGTRSNGAGEHFFTGLTIKGEERRGLLRFDLSVIPAGSTVNSVVLSLNMSRTIVGSTPVALHRATADWGEGASDAEGEEGTGAPAEPGDATWQHTFFDTDFWASPGGDFEPAASATMAVDAEGPYTWGTTAGMEADVTLWIDDPGQNFGWVVLGDESGEGGPTAKRFDTREIDGGIGTLAPQLTVDFTPPVPVSLQSFDVE